MPKYVLDSGPIMFLKHYPETIFKSFWQKFNKLIIDGAITSTSDVLLELRPDAMYEWAKRNKILFPKPTLDEQRIVQQILGRHPELIRREHLLSGKPVADPFVIARASHLKLTVVTIEKLKPNAHNIPNICSEMQIPCIHGIIGIMEEELWEF